MTIWRRGFNRINTLEKKGDTLVDNVIERRCFWDMVNIRADNECWNWEGGKTGGYGEMFIKGVQYRAHRISYILKYGQIPNDKMVLHNCDNPLCVNPFHLYLGDHKDNMKDSHVRGRHGKKLIFDNEQICLIHKLFDGGLTKTAIASQLGYNKYQIDTAFKKYCRRM